MTSITSTISSILNDYYGNLSSTKSTSTTNTTSTTSTTSTTTTTSTTGTTSSSSSTASLSNTALSRYFGSTSSDKLDDKTIFSKLSIDVGGDGKTISKDQLNTYITKAENGNIKISDNELNGLKKLQSNWDTISDGSSSINYSDVALAGYKSTLLSMAPNDTSASKTDYKSLAEASTEEAYNKIMNAALGTSTSSSNSTSNLSSMLKTLLSGTTDENDDSNAESIAKIINLLSSASTTSTIETEA